jgi:hypothetical protein
MNHEESQLSKRAMFAVGKVCCWSHHSLRGAYEEGGYEVEVSPFAPEAAEIVVKEGLQMLQAWLETQL